MSNTWIVVGAVSLFILVMVKQTLTKMISDELQARVDDLPAILVALAVRRLPRDQREFYRVDWEGNLLAAFNDRYKRFPVTRFFRSFFFAGSLLISARAIRKEAGSASTAPTPATEQSPPVVDPAIERMAVEMVHQAMEETVRQFNARHLTELDLATESRHTRRWSSWVRR